MKDMSLMEYVFESIHDTVMKSTIEDFRRFLDRYKGVSKWIICSDYCVGDKSKPNDVICFTLFPYIIGFKEWKDFIGEMQRVDIKNTSRISDVFCKFMKSGQTFSFCFILDREDNYFEKWKDKGVLTDTLEIYKECINNLNERYLDNAEHYHRMGKSINNLTNQMKSKSFNVGLCQRIFVICFLVSYIKCILISETDKVELFSWLSDRDSITGFCDGIYKVLYEIISLNVCEYKHKMEEYLSIKEVMPRDPAIDNFYEEYVRVPDYLCGILADYDMNNNRVSKDKHLKGVEYILSDNNSLSIIRFRPNGVCRVLLGRIEGCQ